MTDRTHIGTGRLPNPFNLVEEYAQRATPSVTVEIPLYAYPIAEAGKKAMDVADRGNDEASPDVDRSAG